MGVIKLAVISFIVFFLVITGMSLFIPSHLRISKAISINAGKEVVMEQIKDVSKWKNWYPDADSLKIIFTNKKAAGLMPDSLQRLIEVTGITDSSVVAAMAGPGHRKIEMGWNMIPGNNQANVSVQWYMDFHLRWYPWEKFRSLMFEKTYGVQMEKGLSNLKIFLEK